MGPPPAWVRWDGPTPGLRNYGRYKRSEKRIRFPDIDLLSGTEIKNKKFLKLNFLCEKKNVKEIEILNFSEIFDFW